MIKLSGVIETGRKWGRYYVGPIQFMVCYGAVVACTLLGGQCMKVIIINSYFLFSFSTNPFQFLFSLHYDVESFK